MNSKLDEIHKKICLKIKIERTKMGWSQEQLAEYAGVNKNTIGAIERNENSPSVNILIKLAMAFNTSVSALTDISNL